MEKTIRMPKKLLAKWLAALRSEKYAQVAGIMHDGDNGFCCLGVLQYASCGEIHEDGRHYLPAQSWLSKNGVEFRNSVGETSKEPYLPSLEKNASSANDDGATFAEIADAIEACAEGI